MKRLAFVIAVACVFLSPIAISQQGNVTEEKLMTAGYLLLKSSGNFKMMRNDLSALIRKYQDLDEWDMDRKCPIYLLQEHILMVETICKYESVLLGTMKDLEESQKAEQYAYHHTLVKEDVLNRLYLNYQRFQSTYAGIDDKLFLEIADRTEEEMIQALRIVEKVIKLLTAQ